MRMDLVLTKFTPGRAKCIDISITNPEQLKYNNRIIPYQQEAKDSELHKVQKYSHIITASISHFDPMVLEIHGIMGPQSRILFNDLTLKLMSTGSGSSSFFL